MANRLNAVLADDTRLVLIASVGHPLAPSGNGAIADPAGLNALMPLIDKLGGTGDVFSRAAGGTYSLVAAGGGSTARSRPADMRALTCNLNIFDTIHPWGKLPASGQYAFQAGWQDQAMPLYNVWWWVKAAGAYPPWFWRRNFTSLCWKTGKTAPCKSIPDHWQSPAAAWAYP
jgi:hypothetical protein